MLVIGKYSAFLQGIDKYSMFLLRIKAASSQQFPESVFCLCQFVKYNKGYDTRRDNKKRGGAIDYSLRLRLGHLQTVYLGKFYWELKVRSVCLCVHARTCVCVCVCACVCVCVYKQTQTLVGVGRKVLGKRFP